MKGAQTMKPHIRYYNFWDKKLEKYEKEPYLTIYRLSNIPPKKQIERTYKSNMITEEQYNELIQRYEALQMEAVKNTYGLKKPAPVAENHIHIHIN